MNHHLNTPLSEALRPHSLKQVFGQEHITGEYSLLYKVIKGQKPISLLFWGPPGSGKTTLARIYANSFDHPSYFLTGVEHGAKDIKEIIDENKKSPLLYKKPIIFLDEIHRFNKAQQDLFLPSVEKGEIILVAATTEDPSFSINPALVSRLRVFPLRPLNKSAITSILESFLNKFPILKEDAINLLIEQANGDARFLLNSLENIQTFYQGEKLDSNDLKTVLTKKMAKSDRYTLISAMHKSIRGSNPDATLYYLARLLQGGESPEYVLRRLIRIAAEDIGLADPNALSVANHALLAYKHLGSKEGDLCIAEVGVYLALSPKSNAIEVAFAKAQELAKATSELPPPNHLINASTKLHKELGFGKDYLYDHDQSYSFSGQNHFPEALQEEKTRFYHPKEVGFEREMKKRLEYFEKLKTKKRSLDHVSSC